MLISAPHATVRTYGADLGGQPDQRTPLPSGRLPAPPHDESGHTWQHPDVVQFRIVKEGTTAIVGGGYESEMPGFADVQSDAEIRAVLDYIKSTWPERERNYQQRVSQAMVVNSPDSCTRFQRNARATDWRGLFVHSPAPDLFSCRYCFLVRQLPFHVGWHSCLASAKDSPEFAIP